MGLYDTFIDKEKSVQLKNFQPILFRCYKKGDKIENYCEHPKDALFFCFVDATLFVLVKNQIFVRIINLKEASEIARKEKLRIFNCWDEEFTFEKNDKRKRNKHKAKNSAFA